MLGIEQKAKFSELQEIINEDKNRLEELTKDMLDYEGCIIKGRQNDITDEPVDAIVNPANEYLSNGAGAARAIQNGAGPEYRRECDLYIQEHDRLPTGEILVTTGGSLPCDKVINVVGPQCEKNQEDITKECKQLKSVLIKILEAIIEYDFKSVCILAISTGLFNFPLKECVKIYARTIRRFIDKNKEAMAGREIILCKCNL